MQTGPHSTPGAAPNWDMTPYFTAPDGPDYDAFWRALTAELARLQRLAGTLPAIAADDRAQSAWITFLTELERADSRLHHVESYLDCMGAADARDEVVKRHLGELAALHAEREKLLVTVRAHFASASEPAFRALLDHAAMRPVSYFLERTRARARFAMEPALEELAADLSVTGLSAWGRLYDQISGNLTFELAVPGRAPEILPVSMARTLTEDRDPAVRKAAFLGANHAWEGVAEPVAACLNAIAGTRLLLHARRGVAHFLDPALFDAGITRGTLDAMLAAVRARRELPRRYLRTKARLLGCERLGFQDQMAPLPGQAHARIPWDDAMRLVSDAFGSGYPALRAFATHAFTKRWIDHEPRIGKRPGGFCSTSPELGQSRIFMTYNGSMGDVETLAHELGHAFHSWLMRDLRSWARVYPMTLAETASTFAEQLVTDAMLGQATSSAARVAMLDNRLQKAAVFLLNIPMRFDFEHALYETRRHGELSVSRLREMMLAAQQENYGDALAPDQRDPWFWASKLHFYVTDISFYNFPYTFGYLFSLGIFAHVKASGPDALASYEQLLRRTGSATAEAVAREGLGVDLQAPDFWHASIDLIEADLMQLEREAAAPP
jgi:oligoendopeptidase F